MATQALDEKSLLRRDEWIQRITALVDETERWATEEGWSVHRDQKQIRERRAGEYMVPTLQMRTREGELFLTPIALHVMGADGRVDLQAWPTLNRVRLVGDGPGWKIITDSNVPLREGWNRETLVRLAHDLQS